MSYGGAVYSESYADRASQVSLTNCSLVGNAGGGAIANLSSTLSLQLANCSLLNNTTQYLASDIFNDTNFPNPNPNGPPITWLINCIVWGGSQSFQDALGKPQSTMKFTSVSYSLLQSDVGNYVDEGNNIKSSVFPFVNASDVHLKAGSLAINAGSNAAYPAMNGPSTDLGGDIRIQQTTIDMGAYEFQATLMPVSLLRFTAQAQPDCTVLLS